MREPKTPIKIDSTSNGEFVPREPPAHVTRALDEAAARITDNARRVGQARRAFLQGLCGAATTLLTLNEAHARASRTGGIYDLPAAAAFEPAAAEKIAGREFIFDVQTHMVDADGLWRQGTSGPGFLAGFPQARCGESDPVRCFSADHLIREVFLDSDTDMAVMSFVPSMPGMNPLTMAVADGTRHLISRLDGTDRLFLHAMIVPNVPPLQARFDEMNTTANVYRVAAWKVYTQFGPGGGWRLDDPAIGVPFIEHARRLGIRRICIHKGLSFPGDRRFANCEDVGRAARMFPDVDFIIYHSGYEMDKGEGPYDAATATRGIDSLVKTMLDNNLGPGSNVYAELGSTWRALMRDPTQAAHGLGKLLRYVGPRNVLWGTDSIWYGSPQDQIQAFRAFQIAPALRERHGYPELTAALKADIFGLNGARVYGIQPNQRRADAITHMRAAYLENPSPSFATYGPRTVGEFEAFLAARGGLPG